MKMRELLAEAMLVDLRALFESTLAEAINKRLLSAAAALSNRSASDRGLKGIDLEQLASLIAAVKVLSKEDYRSTMTRDDIGINPNSAQELFNFFDSVPDNFKEKLNHLPQEVVASISYLAPKIKRAELEKLEQLESRDEDERREAEQYLKTFAAKLDLAFNKVRSAASHKSSKVTA
jgi:hypothetical protein